MKEDCRIYTNHFVNIASNSRNNTGWYIFFDAVYGIMMNINKGNHKHLICCDTSFYQQSGVNILNSCYFTYSLKEKREQHFRKSFIISCRVNELQLNFLELLCYNFLSSHKSLSSNPRRQKFLPPMISHPLYGGGTSYDLFETSLLSPACRFSV